MRTLRYIIRLTIAFINRFKAIISIGIVIGFVFFGFIYFLLPQMLASNTERIGVEGRYNADELPTWMQNMLSTGLTRIDDQGNVLPAIAKSWSTPDKGQTWVFELDDKVTWQDGSKVTAEDINYNFEDVKVEKKGKSITFKLQSPFSPFPAVVSKPLFKRGLLGVGKWRVINLSLAGIYVENITLKDSSSNTKIFKFFPTEERTKIAYKLGEVDTLQEIIDLQPFDTWKTVSITKKVNENQVVAIFFNTQEGPLADKSVRQALYYALDKDKLDEGTRAVSPISTSSWAYNPQTKPYDYDTKRSAELLSSVTKNGQNPLNIKLITMSALLDVAEKITKEWKAVGVNATAQVVSALPQDFQAFLVIYDIPKDPDEYITWHSTQEETNIANYKNPRIDKLLEDGRLEVDQDKRRKIYMDFQRFLAEDAPAAFLYHPVYYTVTRN